LQLTRMDHYLQITKSSMQHYAFWMMILKNFPLKKGNCRYQMIESMIASGNTTMDLGEDTPE
jgi:hypothetical protein